PLPSSWRIKPLRHDQFPLVPPRRHDASRSLQVPCTCTLCVVHIAIAETLGAHEGGSSSSCSHASSGSIHFGVVIAIVVAFISSDVVPRRRSYSSSSSSSSSSSEKSSSLKSM